MHNRKAGTLPSRRIVLHAHHRSYPVGLSLARTVPPPAYPSVLCPRRRAYTGSLRRQRRDQRLHLMIADARR
jgi:hypothetical protein